MEQQQSQRKELFKERAVAKDRTYFFNVNESIKGTKYLTINEGRKVGDKYEYSRVIIFEDQLQVFADGFKKAYEFLKADTSS